MVKGLSHITFSVSNLDVSLAFYRQVFDAALLFRSDTVAYLDLAGLWIALNVQEDIPRHEIRHSYTHLAFSIDADDLPKMEPRLRALGVPVRPDRLREAGEGASLYFTDPDGHLLEVHAGDLKTRLGAYQDEIVSSAHE